MSSILWEILNASEEDCIEYSRCSENLRVLGLNKREIDRSALKCHKCHLRGRCSVSREDAFGTKTY